MWQRLAAVGGVVLLGTGFADAFSWDATREQQALRLVRQFQASHRVPTIAVSVTVDGKTVLATALDANGAIPRGEEDIRFQIGSVTKQFTAAAVLALIEDRTIVPSINAPLTLETRLSELFAADLEPQSDLGNIKVRQLLTMSSGLPSYTDDPLAHAPDRTGSAPASRAIGAMDIIRRLRGYRPTIPATFEYSNTNYFVLALALHVLNGGYQPTTAPLVRQYIHRRLLAPAGMTRSGFLGEPAPPGTIDAPPNFLRAPMLNHGAWPTGAGDLVSTASDLARWNVALTSGKVIDQASVKAMFQGAAPVHDASEPYRGCMYAMGWYACDRPGHRLYQHDGVISGFMTSNAIARQADGSWMTVTVLGNIDASVDIVGLVRDIVQLAK